MINATVAQELALFILGGVGCGASIQGAAVLSLLAYSLKHPERMDQLSASTITRACYKIGIGLSVALFSLHFMR